jgi:hypothetical protein
MKIKIHKKADNSKQIHSIDVFRNDKWAYTITANEFTQILYELSKNRLGVSTVQTLKDIISINVIPPVFRLVIDAKNDKEDNKE